MIEKLPGIAYAAMPKAGGTTSPVALRAPSYIVVHDTGNDTSSAAGEANYAATRTDDRSHWTSAHFYVDEYGVLGSLPLSLRAWAAYGWANTHGVHVEMCRRKGSAPAGIRLTAAALVRQLCLQFGIPPVHRDGAYIRSHLDVPASQGGIIGHQDVTASHIDANDHTDPGFSQADWDQFMGWVTNGSTTGDSMSVWDEQIGAGYTPGGHAYGDNLFRTAVGYTWYRVDEIKGLIAAGNAADEARDRAATAAVQALADALRAGGGSVDDAAIIARIDQVATAESSAVQALTAEVARLNAVIRAGAQAQVDAAG